MNLEAPFLAHMLPQHKGQCADYVLKKSLSGETQLKKMKVAHAMVALPREQHRVYQSASTSPATPALCKLKEKG